MTRRPNGARRPGLSLLEVLVAMAIFLFSLVALGRLVTASSERALEIRFQSEAIQICQTKLAEVASGAIPLSSQDDSTLDEDPDWHWSLDAEQGSVSNLWNVTVKASRAGPGGEPRAYCTLTQMVLDPSQRGSSLDTVTINNTNGTNSSSSSSSSGSSGKSSQGQGAAPAQAPGAAASSPRGGNGLGPPGGGGGSRPAGGGGFSPPGGGAGPPQGGGFGPGAG
jgi:type II secretory pathway pseudopilin PulG